MKEDDDTKYLYKKIYPLITEYINERIYINNSNNKPLEELDNIFKKKDWYIDNYKYIDRLKRYCKCHPFCMLINLIYIDRLNMKYIIDKNNVQLLYSTLLVLCIKFFEDLHYSNEFYSKIFSVSLEDFNEMEKIALSYLDYSMYIDYNDIMKLYKLII